MSQENVEGVLARMSLVGIRASRLEGHAHRWGKALTVIDPNGNAVIDAELGKTARPAYAVLETVDGAWRVVQSVRSELTVIDPSGNVAARARSGEVVLASGESLPWTRRAPRLRRRYRLGDDLWVARPTWLPRRRFRADLSQALLARSDRDLIVVIATVLTDDLVKRRLLYALATPSF